MKICEILNCKKKARGLMIFYVEFKKGISLALVYNDML